MTNYYASLEQLQKKKSNMLSDEWGIGIIFYMLCADTEHPFYLNELTDEAKIKALTSKKLQFPSKYFSKRGFSKEVEEIISGLLQTDMKKRWKV